MMLSCPSTTISTGTSQTTRAFGASCLAETLSLSLSLSQSCTWPLPLVLTRASRSFPRSGAVRNRRQTVNKRVVCVAQPGGSRSVPQVYSTAGVSKLKALITPFNDPKANAKMLSLATAQMLCSVATLIHDTYLPVYMSDVLGMSNSKIGNLQAIAQFLSKASGSVSGIFADILSPARMVIFGTLLTTINKPVRIRALQRSVLGFSLAQFLMHSHVVCFVDVCSQRACIHLVWSHRLPVLDHVRKDLRPHE